VDENKSKLSAAEEGTQIREGTVFHGDGVPDVPEVQVEDPHWKVADGMTGPDGLPDYVIGQIAIVEKGQEDGKDLFDIVFFDTKGIERGRRYVKEL
jgi:hypothetical protein